MSTVRTRFAPSPTGFLHVGGLRTALYNYLYARQHEGVFLLRIEDTDQTRYVKGALENLIKTLHQVELDYDEGPEKEGDVGPYIQSQRTEIYIKYAQELLAKKTAYLCFCTPERLAEMREEQIKNKQAPMYDRLCLHLTPEEIEEKKSEGLPHVIRQSIPHGEHLEFTDLIRGVVKFETEKIDDQILVKSDGYPTYHLASVVDDHLMKISHVIRGEDWLPSTPKHILLYRAFGWDVPQFAHLPLLLNKDKTKLSKRQNDVSVENYLENGYDIHALINFVALLGWHPGEGDEQEVFTRQELIDKFSLEKVHKGGAIFDTEKLDWFNFQWRKKDHHEQLAKIAKEIEASVKISEDNRGTPVYKFSDEQKEHRFCEMRGGLLAEICKNYIPHEWIKTGILHKALITVEEKIFRAPGEIEENIAFYFDYKVPGIDLLCNPKMKVNEDIARDALNCCLNDLEGFEHFDSMDKLQQHLLHTVKVLELKNGQVFWPLRAALTGEQYSPGVFEVLWTLGKEESLKRVQATIDKQF